MARSCSSGPSSADSDSSEKRLSPGPAEQKEARLGYTDKAAGFRKRNFRLEPILRNGGESSGNQSEKGCFQEPQFEGPFAPVVCYHGPDPRLAAETLQVYPSDPAF